MRFRSSPKAALKFWRSKKYELLNSLLHSRRHIPKRLGVLALALFIIFLRFSCRRSSASALHRSSFCSFFCSFRSCFCSCFPRVPAPPTLHSGKLGLERRQPRPLVVLLVVLHGCATRRTRAEHAMCSAFCVLLLGLGQNTEFRAPREIPLSRY